MLKCQSILCGSSVDQKQQDRRWNADKPSSALDLYIPTWLTNSPANRYEHNFGSFYRNPPILETVSIASMCQHGPHWESFFSYWNATTGDNSSNGECLWINDDQNSQRQERVQQHLTSYAASRVSPASCQHVGAWVDSACMSVHNSFVIDGQHSNRI